MPGPVTEAAVKKIKRIKLDLTEAIALRSYLIQWTNKLADTREKLNGTRFANGYVAVNNAVLIGLVMSVNRMWDKQKRAHAFPSLSRDLNEQEFLDEIHGEGEQERLCARDQFIEAVGNFLNSEECQAIRIARNAGAAHNLDLESVRTQLAEPRLPKYRELNNTIDRSCRILNMAETAVTFSPTMMQVLPRQSDEIFAVIISDIKNYNERNA